MPTVSSPLTADLVSVDTTRPQHRRWRTSVGLSLQRGWCRLKDWYTESYPTCDSGEFEPSWVSARRANFTNCWFYRLPDELILQILRDLDNVGRAMTMRTCGRLLRISFDPTLFPIPSRLLGHRSAQDIRAWPPFSPSISYNPADGREKLRLLQEEVEIEILLDRDRFCSACRQFRKDGGYEKALEGLKQTLWCSHCNQTHKRIFFSAQQRAASKETRICVLAEGRAPFCAHRSLRFDSTPTNVAPLAHWGAEDICRHRHHEPLSWYRRWTEVLENRPSPSYRRPRLHFFPPKMGRSFGHLLSETTVFLFHLDHSIYITRALLQEKLVATAHILDKMLCPHVTARDGQLLLPFGPDRCACFDGPRWVPHSCEADHRNLPCCKGLFPDSSFSCCRCNAAGTPGLSGYFMAGDGRPYLSRRHEYRCVTCRAEYAWRRDGSAVYLEIRIMKGVNDAEMLTPGSHSPSLRPRHWLYSIHPESWGIQNDEELRHVAWCEDINCMSRWRWESLTRLLEESF